MASEEHGYPIDILVILIFVYLSGIAMGILITVCWQQCTLERKELEVPEAPPPPTPVPDPPAQAGEVRVAFPPPVVIVGTTTSCHTYHDVDNFDRRCNAMEDLVRRNSGNLGLCQRRKPQRVTKRLTPCQVCFPRGTYTQEPRGSRHRRVQDKVPLHVD